MPYKFCYSHYTLNSYLKKYEVIHVKIVCRFNSARKDVIFFFQIAEKLIHFIFQEKKKKSQYINEKIHNILALQGRLILAPKCIYVVNDPSLLNCYLINSFFYMM